MTMPHSHAPADSSITQRRSGMSTFMQAALAPVEASPRSWASCFSELP